MNSFEFNKIAAAILLTGVVLLGSSVLVHEVFTDKHHGDDHATKHAYEIAEGVAKDHASDTPAVTKPAGPEPILALLADADIAAGQKVAKKCAACHSFDEGGPNKVGPNLWNIVDADKAAVPGYAYSAALQAHEGPWDYEALNAFFYKPKTYVPGTKMNFAGLKKAKDRANLVGYLRSLSNTPAALPDITELAPEAAAEPGVTE